VVTGPYAIPKVIGPPHLSFGDRGLTFASNPDAGTCVRFHQPVAGIDPFGLLRHPGLTVTVEDPEALAGLLDTNTAALDAVAGDEGEGVGSLPLDAVHDDLEGLTASELRARVRDLGVPGASRMKKQELVDLLEGRSRQAS
jgi:hypothetical protein